MEIDAALYLLPSCMSAAPPADVLPARNLAIMREIRHFIVENVREARRFLKRCDPAADISSMTFCELNRHTPPEEVSAYLQPLREGKPVGVLSDAGCPAVADPGALPVAIAQREGLKVVPLVGPSSILMALMGSGFNGQGFAFHGYLPIEEGERTSAVRRLENESRSRSMTQIFIETPYRNEKMLRYLADTLNPATRLCIACDITAPEGETILSLPAAEWKRRLSSPDRKGEFDKRPAIFLLYAGAEESVQQGKHIKKHKSYKK